MFLKLLFRFLIMVEAIFTDGYEFVSVSEEGRFREALEQGKLEEALNILEGLSSGISIREKSLRAKALVEGYRAIVNTSGIGTEGWAELRKSNFEELDKLKKYEDEVGTLDFSRKLFEVVDEHMGYPKVYGGEVNTSGGREHTTGESEKRLGELEGDLEELREYRVIGNVDDCKKYKEDSETIREKVSALDDI